MIWRKAWPCKVYWIYRSNAQEENYLWVQILSLGRATPCRTRHASTSIRHASEASETRCSPFKVSVSSFSFLNNSLFNLTLMCFCSIWLQTEPYQPHSVPPNWGGGHSATGAQTSDPSRQILVGTRKNFVVDLADFGTQTEKVCPPLGN